ncbi:MAG: phosphatidylserine decarboxylase family protein [Steroidobacterales bacterium]
MTASTRAAGGAAPPYRVGEWLPSDQAFLEKWLAGIIQKTHSEQKPLHPVIAEFRDLIEADPQIFMLFHQMFEEVPRRPPYNKDPAGKPQVRDYRHMLQLLNTIMTHAPEFNRSGLVGCPINTIFDWPMGTAAGFTAFLNDAVNTQLKKILNEWARFLNSSASTYVLSQDPHRGWFGADARTAMPDFESQYRCDPGQAHHGFRSWDDFFTREFRPGVRPVALPGDDAVVVNACESAPYKIARQVRLHDRFWLKSQPYSIVHMLANDSLAPLFVGGTIYQAYLSPLSYHRWHSPVSGTVIKAYVKDGTYYSEAPSMGFDPAGPNDSQGYITAVATRALLFIEADNRDIGLMCVLAVGMCEVSTCQITAYEGQHVRKGDQIGMFHFGGSTHCLIFRPGVDLEFDLHDQKPGLESKNILVNSRIATLIRK